MVLSQSRPRRRAARRQGVSILAILVLLLAACAAGGFYYFSYYRAAEGVSEEELILRAVERGPFDHIVLEQGEIESSSNTELICEVKSRGSGGTAILWVVDEGTRVEEGEKLVELDSSQLETELKQQKIVVNNARATLSSSEATLEQAKIARQEYLEGVYKTEEKAIESEIAVAQQELRKAQLNLRSTEKMVAKGLVNALQLEGDQFGVANAQNQLEAAEGRLRVLQNLTKQKMLVQYDSDIEAAVAAREAALSTMSEEEEKLADIEEQIKACVMYAPASGVVVHGNQFSSRGGNAEFVVEPGATVRERQVIIRLPDPTKMQVKAKINESRITLVSEGMPAKIRVDAIEGMVLLGRVKKVNRYAEPGSWFSSSIKEYACEIEIINPPDNIRTGMTAEVRIFVEQKKDALQIPIQGVYEHFGDTYTLVRTPEGNFETRKLTIGATNDTMATIQDGLKEGENIVLNLRNHLDQMDLPAPEQVDGELLADQMPAAALPVQDGPSGSTKPGGNGPGAAGSGGGSGTGGPAGGRLPSANDMVTRILDSLDSDSDGSLSADEAAAADDMSGRLLKDADSDGDGDYSRAELMTAAAKLVARIKAMQSGGGPGGAGSGRPGGGFGG